MSADGRVRPAVLCVLLLVVLAGCGGSSAAAPRRDTFDVPNRTTTRLENLPTGLTRDGVEDPLAVTETHSRILSVRSYRVRRNRTVIGPEGRVRSALWIDARIGPEHRRYLVTIWRNGSDRGLKRVVWGGRRRVLAGHTEGTGPPTAFAVVDPPGERRAQPGHFVSEDLDARSDLYRLLSAAENVSVTRLSTEPYRTYRVRARSVDAADLRPALPTGTLRSAQFEVTVDSRGVVREIVATERVDTDDGTVTVVERYRFRGVGSTTVPTPEWVERARPTTGGSGGPPPTVGPNGTSGTVDRGLIGADT